MALAAGTQLDGYEILGLVGAGGMGEVYRALDPVLKRDVAIKVLPSSVAQDAGRLRRFELEAQATAALDHPNILPIYRFGVFEGAPYLVSALLEGSTLRQVLEHGPLAVRKAIETSVQVAHGLAAAHDKGIVHRDLKPENLFVTKSGLTKILDFGLAKLMQPPTESDGNAPTQTQGTDPGQVMGTAGYMAPEQVRGQTVDHRTDIFAFGAILYEMLSGRRAFHRPTAAETMTAVLREDPPLVSQLGQNTPPGLQRVVQRCLEKNPEQRFQSASDLAFALEALSGSGISAGIAADVAERRRSRKAMIWPAGVAVVLVLAVAAYFVVARQNSGSTLRIAEYTQLTHDGHAGDVVGTDGSRLYLTRGIGQPIGQVATSGGDIETVQIPLPSPYLVDVSPDGSTFLAESYTKGLLPAEPLYVVQVIGGTHRYLVDAQGAAWSADGKTVAYSTPDHVINVIESDGSGAHKLATAKGQVEGLSWAPDSKVIRFDQGRTIWQMSSGGSDVHDLFLNWRPSSWKCCGRWSPDGNFFVFLSEPGSQLWVRDERHRLFRKQHEPVQLTSGPILWNTPAFSRDGKQIFASGSTSRGELVRLDLATKQLQPFLGGISGDAVVFSKDGRSVAYVSYPEGILWKANADGTNRVQLSQPPLYPRLPSWSPDGTQILFMGSSADGPVKAYIASSEGGTPRRLLPDDNSPEGDPTWSPDGQKILFSNSPEVGRDRNSTIRILDLASHQVTELPGSVGMYSPRWSPDRRWIVAASWDSTSLRLFDVKAQQWSPLYDGEAAFPVWSSDSRFFYFLRYRKNAGIYRMQVPGGAVELVKDLNDVHTTGYYGLWLGLDPGGAPLLLRDMGTTDVYALRLEQK